VHDPEKWAPVFGKDHGQTKDLVRRLLAPVQIREIDGTGAGKLIK